MSFTIFFKRGRSKSESQANKSKAKSADAGVLCDRMTLRRKHSVPAIQVPELARIRTGTFIDMGMNNPDSLSGPLQNRRLSDSPRGLSVYNGIGTTNMISSSSPVLTSERRYVMDSLHQVQARGSIAIDSYSRETDQQPDPMNDNTIADIVQGYARPRDVETDSRLSRFEWSPRGSTERRSRSADQSVSGTALYQHDSLDFPDLSSSGLQIGLAISDITRNNHERSPVARNPTEPPTTPLPRLPVGNFNYESHNLSLSSSPSNSYGTTRHLLELSSPIRINVPQRMRGQPVPMPVSSSGSTPPQDGYLPRGWVSLEAPEDAVDLGPGGSQTSSSSAIIRSGTPPLLFGTRAIGIRGTSRAPSKGIKSQDDEHDWETVADSGFNLHRTLVDIGTFRTTGSSLADVSDSSQPSVTRSIVGARVLVHPAHPRYQYSWRMLQDMQSGETVLTPDYSESKLFADENVYQHPEPLQSNHEHPFSTPPPQMKPLQVREATTGGGITLPLRVSSARPERSSDTNSEPSIQSEQWLTTTDGLTSFTGGTVKLHHRRTIDGSLDAISANAPGNFEERIKNHPIFRRDSDVDSLDQLFTSTSIEDLSPEIQHHRQHLINNSLLPREQPPLVGASKRHSTPLPPLRPRSLAPMSKSTATGVAPDGNQNMRMRSPRRNGRTEDITMGVLTPFSSQNTHFTNPSLERQNRRQARRAKRRAKDKMSDGESSPEAKISAEFFEQARFRNDDAASLTPTHHPERRSIHSQTESSISITPTIGTTIHWVGSYGYFIQDMRGPPTRTGRIQRPISVDRPVARVESPRLHRLPRPEGPVIEKRKMELSCVFLALCMVVPPMLVIYGHGFLDGVMQKLSKGEILGFRKREKIIALVMGYTCIALICVGLMLLFILLL